MLDKILGSWLLPGGMAFFNFASIPFLEFKDTRSAVIYYFGIWSMTFWCFIGCAERRRKNKQQVL